MSEAGSGVTGFAFDLAPCTLCRERTTLRQWWWLFVQQRLRVRDRRASESWPRFGRGTTKREENRGRGQKVTVACRRVLNMLARGCPYGPWPLRAETIYLPLFRSVPPILRRPFPFALSERYRFHANHSVDGRQRGKIPDRRRRRVGGGRAERLSSGWLSSSSSLTLILYSTFFARSALGPRSEPRRRCLPPRLASGGPVHPFAGGSPGDSFDPSDSREGVSSSATCLVYSRI